MNSSVSSSASALLTRDAVAGRLRRRYRTERRFKLACASALIVGGIFLAVLFTSIISKGYSAFTQHFVGLEVYFDPEVIDPSGSRDPEDLAAANYNAVVRDSLTRQFPDVTGRTETRKLAGLVSNSTPYELQKRVEANPGVIGTTEMIWVPASDDIDMLLKGKIPRDVAEESRRVSDHEITWIDTLEDKGLVKSRFNKRFFTAGDSREPELAGVRGAAVGSAFTMLVCLALSFPLGIASAIYLEEFAPKNRITDLIEVNINNLAAVPSIVYGLLGLAVFLNFFHMPRSAPLVGGIVLSLMTLPRIIIPARAAMQSIPPSIEEAAYGLGASPMQVMFHHILPLSLPGILTGTIIGMAQALGETAPLLMIGMVAFIVDIPASIFDPATVLPVQVYLWADSPERAFVEKTSGAIMVLLAFLIVMNLAAVIIRRKTERKW